MAWRRRTVDDLRPETDVYAVTWQGDYVMVKHFPSRTATEPCCRIGAERAANETAADCLVRAYLMIEVAHDADRAPDPAVPDDPDDEPPW